MRIWQRSSRLLRVLRHPLRHRFHVTELVMLSALAECQTDIQALRRFAAHLPSTREMTSIDWQSRGWDAVLVWVRFPPSAMEQPSTERKASE